MLIRDTLIIELAKECHKMYINDLDNKIRKESLRLAKTDLKKEDIDIINSRIVALKKALKSIKNITQFINLNEDIFGEFICNFDENYWSYCYIKVDEEGLFQGYEFAKAKDKPIDKLQESININVNENVVRGVDIQ